MRRRGQIGRQHDGNKIEINWDAAPTEKIATGFVGFAVQFPKDIDFHKFTEKMHERLTELLDEVEPHFITPLEREREDAARAEAGKSYQAAPQGASQIYTGKW